MKRAGFIILATVLIVVMAGAIYWMEINIVPSVPFPKPAAPSPNAYDTFTAASNLDVDSNKATWANADRPPGYKDPYHNPDDRYYTPAEKKALLHEYLPLLAKVREGFPYPFVDPNPENLLGGETNIREVARMVAFAGSVYEEEGDLSDATDTYLDDIEMGEKVTHGPGAYPLLNGLACEQMAIRRLWTIIDRLNAPQTAAALQRLQRVEADSVRPEQMMSNTEESDQAGLMDVFHQPYWRVVIKKANQRFSPPWQTFLSSDRAIMRNEVSFDNAWVREVRKPYADRLPLPTVPADSFHQWVNRFRAVPSATLYGGQLNQTRMTYWLKDMVGSAQMELMVTALALHAYKLNSGAYPSSLSQLIPKYLSATPADPFAVSGPLRYKRTRTSYLLYSVGPDGKDDGGTPIGRTIMVGSVTEAIPNSGHIVIESKGDIVAGVNIY